MPKRRKNPVKYALQALGMVIVALVTLEATSLIQYFFSRKTIYEEATRHAEDQLEITNLMITDVLDQVETAVKNNVWPVRKTLSSPDSLWSLVRRMVETNPTVYGSSIALMENYIPRKGRYYAPYAYRSGDQIDTAQLGKESYGYTTKEWFVKPLEINDGYWSEPYFDTGGGEMLMTTYSLPVTDNKGKVAAVLTADISLDWLTDLVGDIRVFPDAFSVLLSRTGQLMVCPAPAFVMKKTAQEVASTLADSTSVRDITLAMLAGEEGNRQVLYKGQREYVFYAPIDRAGWSMAIVVPRQEIYGDVQNVGLLVILLQVIGILLMCYILAIAVQNHIRLQEVSDKKNRFENELQIARGIQMSMIPKAFLTGPGRGDIDMSGVIVPAKEVGGDLYDFFIREDQLFFCIGDVSGKGVPAALVMAVTRSLFRSVCAHEKSPRRIVSLMNEAMAEMNDNNMFVTFFVGVLNLRNGHLRYCNAGHNAPVSLIPGNRPVFLDVVPNISLGVMQGIAFQEQETVLSSGQGLFLYTDGLTEAENAKHVLFGEKNLLQTVFSHVGESADALVKSVEQAVQDHIRDCDPSDDLTMLVIRFLGPLALPGIRHRLTLHNDIDEIARLTAFMDDIATEAGIDRSLALSLNLALEEAVANVIRYAYPEGTEGLVDIDAIIGEERLDFTITDSGVPFDPTEVPPPNLTLDVANRPIGGLGIYLVGRIMDRVFYDRIDGKNVLSMTKNR